MNLTTAGSADRKNIKNNGFVGLLACLLFLYWIYGWFFCINLQDWIIENLLIVICLFLLVVTRRWHRLSDASYLCIFMFAALHLYGAEYAYTKNSLGAWLQATYHLWRNPYDRIVHFSFGFFMAYPFREVLLTKFRVSRRLSFFLPIEIAFSLGTVFELIEWSVAAFTNKETGETYVATQGDVWDAQKDIAMAAFGAALSMLLTWLLTKREKARL